MKRSAIAALLVGVCSGCGEDKNYGDPIDDPNATQSALAAVVNAQQLPSMATNDSALGAVNGLSANFNLMTGAKYNAEVNAAARADLEPGGRVDEACVVIGPTSITYDDCDFIGATVNGTVTIDGDNVSMSVRFESGTEDLEQVTEVRADVDVSAAAIAGFVDFDVDIATDSARVTSRFEGDFDVELVDGCAVAGDLEVHATASGAGRSVSVWALAEYGPSCEIVIVR